MFSNVRTNNRIRIPKILSRSRQNNSDSGAGILIVENRIFRICGEIRFRTVAIVVFFRYKINIRDEWNTQDILQSRLCLNVMYSNVITKANSVHFVYLLFLKLQIDSQTQHLYEIIVCNLAKNTVFKFVKRWSVEMAGPMFCPTMQWCVGKKNMLPVLNFSSGSMAIIPLKSCQIVVNCFI